MKSIKEALQAVIENPLEQEQITEKLWLLGADVVNAYRAEAIEYGEKYDQRGILGKAYLHGTDWEGHLPEEVSDEQDILDFIESHS